MASTVVGVWAAPIQPSQRVVELLLHQGSHWTIGHAVQPLLCLFFSC